MNSCKRDGNEEDGARFRFRRPDSDVDPYGSDAPDDVFPDYDDGKADEVYEEKDAESDPLVVCVLIWFSWFPGVTKFDADEGREGNVSGFLQ